MCVVYIVEIEFDYFMASIQYATILHIFLFTHFQATPFNECDCLMVDSDWCVQSEFYPYSILYPKEKHRTGFLEIPFNLS